VLRASVLKLQMKVFMAHWYHKKRKGGENQPKINSRELKWFHWDWKITCTSHALF